MNGTRTTPLRIGNASGYYGDRIEAVRELVEQGPLDVLTGDYLAELTMFLLWKARQKDPSGGYARTFLTQMEHVLGTCLDRGIRIVTNAGGLNPAGLATRLGELAGRLGLAPRIAHVSGDDVAEDLPGWLAAGIPLANLDTGKPFAELGKEALTANAYLGGWGIREALVAGADVVVCGRVTDAALVIGPAAAAFGWRTDDWDRLAGALVAGHVLECGAQATGGNFAFFDEVADPRLPGFPVADIHPDGSSVIGKQPGTGGAVTVDTVTAQLVYEIGGGRYANPDVVARFDSIRLTQAGRDRVRIDRVRGEPAPDTTKIAINYLGGYRNEMTMVLTGLDIEDKAAAAMRAVRALWNERGFDILEADLLRSDRPNPRRNEEACAFLRVTVKDQDRKRAGRVFSDVFVQAALSSYPGFFLTTPPQPAQEYAVYWPTLVPEYLIPHCAHLPDGTVVDAPRPPTRPMGPDPQAAPPLETPGEETDAKTVTVPLGRIFGTRSGDKGGNANLGVWARTDEQYRWLANRLTSVRLVELLPDLTGHRIVRHELPSIKAVNFVVVGLLGEGVAASTRMDRQAKGLGEYLGCKPITVPADLLTPDDRRPGRETARSTR